MERLHWQVPRSEFTQFLKLTTAAAAELEAAKKNGLVDMEAM